MMYSNQICLKFVCVFFFFFLNKISLTFFSKKCKHSTKFKLKTSQILTMKTIFLIITRKEMFSNNNRNYIRNKVRKI